MKTYQKILLFVVAFFFACQNKQNSKEINIIIEDGISYKYDTGNKIFTVFHLNKEPTEVKFTLTKEEENSIIQNYYSLGIDEYGPNLEINNNCNIMPNFFSIINIKVEGLNQRIKIYEDCQKYDDSILAQANKINSFKNFVIKIINNKEKVKNAPISDMINL